jgi:hypothetical protein
MEAVNASTEAAVASAKRPPQSLAAGVRRGESAMIYFFLLRAWICIRRLFSLMKPVASAWL